MLQYKLQAATFCGNMYLTPLRADFRSLLPHSSAGAAALCEVVRGLTFFSCDSRDRAVGGVGGGGYFFAKIKIDLTKKNLTKITEPKIAKKSLIRN